jgi:UDP-glucose 4-epimerase
MSDLPQRVVLLGGSGFLGRAVGRKLTRMGVDVMLHSSKTLDLTREDASDLLAGQLDAGAALLFAAALTPDRGQTIASFTANVAMAATVARALELRPVPCVFVSSDAVYGFGDEPVTEATPPAPGGFYGLAKYTSEKLLEYVAAAKALRLLSLRVAAVFGPGDPHASYGPNAFARSLANDRSVRLFGQGEEERDHLYVDDAARLVVALMRAGATGVFNIATGTSRSFAQVVDAIRSITPYQITVTHAPRRTPITHRSYDIALLERVVPRFAFTPFEDSLRATLAAFGAL